MLQLRHDSFGRAVIRVSAILLMALGTSPAGAQGDDDPCLSHDYTRMRATLRAVAAATTETAARGASASLGPCLTFEVRFSSTLTIKTPTGVEMRATGTSAFITSLGAGSLQGADFDFASPPEGVEGSMAYRDVSISGGECPSTVKVGKPTPWNFWLGVTLGPNPRAALVASPDEVDLHDVDTKCSKRFSLRERAAKLMGPKARQSIFAQGWVVAHGLGDDGKSGGGGPDDAKKLIGGTDAGNVAELERKAKELEQMQKSGASPEAIERKMREMMPGLEAADKKLTEAEDNSMITLVAAAENGNPVFARIEINKETEMTDGQGGSNGQGKVIERTVIEVIHKPRR